MGEIKPCDWRTGDTRCTEYRQRIHELESENKKLKTEQTDFEYNASQIINAAETKHTALLERLESLVSMHMSGFVPVGHIQQIIKEARE